MPPPLAIGIDLGTTNSAIAYINESGRSEVVRNADGESTTPSVVYFGAGLPLVGEQAKLMQAAGEEAVASFFKRSMGDPYFLPHLGGKDRSPVELSALVLSKLKQDAEASLKRSIEKAVITVPAYFNNAQRQATIDAGRLAGLDVLQIINEPTAAALAYRMDETGRTETLLVYDLGGGTFDVSLVKITKEELTVKATAGDHNLGGKDWDDRIAAFLGRQFHELHGTNPLDDDTSGNELLVHAEKAKKLLSTRESTRITIHHNNHSEAIELTRASFEELTRDLMERTQALCEEVLEAIKITWEDLTGVLLVGGSTRMPMVHDYVSRMSGKKPMTGVNVDEAVALGAAVMAARVLGETAGAASEIFHLAAPRRTRDVMSHSLGMIAVSPDRLKYLNSVILPKNQPVPCDVTRPYQLRTSGRKANELEVYMTQGEGESPVTCSFLGKYRFREIAHDPSGTAVLDIAYAYDVNGVVQVTAKQRGTGQSLPVTVEPLPADMSWLQRAPDENVEHAHLTSYLAFDLSGSMSGSPLEEAQEAAREFVRQTDLAHSSIGLISFADSVRTNIKACQDASSLNAAIGKMSIGSVGGGNSASPFAHAHKLLKKVEGPRFLIVLTDGVWSDQPRAIAEAKACHKDEIEVIAIGFGGADRSFLAAVASSEQGSYLAQTGELVATFGTIAQELTETSGGRANEAPAGDKKRSLRFF